MDKKNLLSHQHGHVPLDALNTPSKAQEQMQETSQRTHDSNKKDSTQASHGEDLSNSDAYRTTNKQ